MAWSCCCCHPERYKYLPSPHHQLLFLELQVDLLLEFHQDLSDSASQTHPLHPQFAAYFNASQYIATILRLWGEEKVGGGGGGGGGGG